MKKFLKIFLFFLISVAIIGVTKGVKANSINKISMDIYINDNGDATITETWNCNINEGTEVYHPYYNLGNSEIKNLTVSEKGTQYQTLPNWDTSETLSNKANKCGINKISNGIELCWGVSSYSSHTYTVKYTITKFVSELNDSQMIYWTLIPKDFLNSIGDAYIKIHTNFKIADTVGVWGYGNYGGTAYVYNGYIEMQSDSTLRSNEYMTILVQFPSKTFTTTNHLNHNFDYYYNMAEKGSTKYNGSSSSKSTIFSILGAIILMMMNFVIPISFIFLFIRTSRKYRSTELDFGEEGKKMPKDLPYYRDIPCKGELFTAYYIGYNYNIIKSKTDILGAIILKWLKDSIIKIEQKETGIVFKKENTVIILNETNPDLIENLKEKEIFKMLYEASKDGILENKEFEKWCNKSYYKILSWFSNILKEQEVILENEGLIISEENRTLKIFKTIKHIATPELKQEAIKIAGLKKYLEKYTLIKDREAIEVATFEEYLIYAQLMGIAKKVAKQFKELYPNIIEESNFCNYDNIIFINMCASNGITHAETAKSREEAAESRAESYSSGGGGFSSGDGGGGSFGGGGGGGGIR